MAKRRNFTAAFKAKVALDSLKGDQTLAELSARYKVHPNLITKWKRQAGDGLVGIFSGKPAVADAVVCPCQDRGPGWPRCGSARGFRFQQRVRPSRQTRT